MISKYTSTSVLNDTYDSICSQGYYGFVQNRLDKKTVGDRYSICKLIKNQYSFFKNVNLVELMDTYKVDNIRKLYEKAIDYYTALQFYGTPTYVVDQPLTRIQAGSFDRVISCSLITKEAFFEQIHERPSLPNYKRIAILFLPICSPGMSRDVFSNPKKMMMATYTDVFIPELK